MNEYELKKSLNEIKAKDFQWYEYTIKDTLAMGSSKGSSLNFFEGSKFGIKDTEEGGKKYLVSQSNIDKLFTVTNDIVELILSKSKTSTYEQAPEAEALQFYEYYTITNAQKKAFVKLLSDYSAINEKQENLMRNDMSGGRHRSRYQSPAEEAKELKMEKALGKLDEKKNVVNEKFKEKFIDYIPKDELKSFDLAILINGEFSVEDTDYYVEEFFKKPIVEKPSKVKPK